MKRVVTTPRCLRAVGVLLLACVMGGPVMAAIDSSLLPVPKVDRQLNWYQRQRVRYVNGRLLTKIERLRLLGRQAEIRPLLERARANDPHNIELSLMLMETYTALGNREQALAVCDDILADAPGYLALAIHKGFLACEAAELEAATATFERVLPALPKQDPRRPAIYRALAQTLAATGQHEAALRYAEEWAAQSDQPEAHKLAAEEAIRLEDWKAAVAHYEQELKHDPPPEQRGRLYMNVGYLLTRLGSLQKARAAFINARGLLPTEKDQLEVEQQLGRSAFRTGLYAEAARHFKSYLLRSFDELVAVAYLRALLQAGEAELAALEAKTFTEQSGISENFRREASEALLAAYRDLHRDEDYYRLAKALYDETGRNEYLLEAATAAERTGRTEEASGLYQRHLQATPADSMESR